VSRDLVSRKQRKKKKTPSGNPTVTWEKGEVRIWQGERELQIEEEETSSAESFWRTKLRGQRKKKDRQSRESLWVNNAVKGRERTIPPGTSNQKALETELRSMLITLLRTEWER